MIGWRSKTHCQEGITMQNLLGCKIQLLSGKKICYNYCVSLAVDFQYSYEY